MRRKTQHDREAFGHHLAGLRDKRFWSPADLARRAFGEYIDPETGHVVARGRDLISSYENGRRYPSEKSMRAIARALGVTVNDLVPPRLPPPDDGLEMRAVAGAPDRVVLKVSQEMPLWMAHNIMAMILGVGGP